MVCTVNLRLSHIPFLISSGAGNKHTTLAGIIVPFEHQRAAHDARVYLDQTFQMIEHLVRIVNIALNVVHIVPCGHIYVRQTAPQFLLVLEQNIQVALLGFVNHIFPDCIIHQSGNDSHHNQDNRHDTVSEPFRQRVCHTPQG